MNKTWMPIAAGILEMLAGFIMLFSSFAIGALMTLAPPGPLNFLWPLGPGLLSILSVVGGVFALLRRRWRLALAGAIATLPLFLVVQFGARLLVGDLVANLTPLSFRLVYLVLPSLLSVAIVALVVLSKKEFK